MRRWGAHTSWRKAVEWIAIFLDHGLLRENFRKLFAALTVLHARGIGIARTTRAMDVAPQNDVVKFRLRDRIRELGNDPLVHILWCMYLIYPRGVR